MADNKKCSKELPSKELLALGFPATDALEVLTTAIIHKISKGEVTDLADVGNVPFDEAIHNGTFSNETIPMVIPFPKVYIAAIRDVAEEIVKEKGTMCFFCTKHKTNCIGMTTTEDIMMGMTGAAMALGILGLIESAIELISNKATTFIKTDGQKLYAEYSKATKH